MSKITVAIPTYNRKQYLTECINSVLSQSFQDFEIIVFDSCSNYDINSFIRSFNDNRIRLISSEVLLDSSKNYTRVYGFKYESEYLVIFHDDDTMHPKLLELLSKELDKNNNYIFAGTDMRFIKKSIEMNIFFDIKSYSVCICNNNVDFAKLLLSGFRLCYGSVMYRAKFLPIISVESFYNKFNKWNDRPILLELSKKGPVCVIKEKLVNYRLHTSQDSQQINDEKKLIYMNNLFQFYKDNCLFNDIEKNKLIFLKYCSNSVLSIAGNFSSNLSNYFKIIKKFKQDGFFSVMYVRFNGVYYFLKFISYRLKNFLISLCR